MTSVSIIIPTRNEGENIAPLLSRIETAMVGMHDETEIIFVDDGSIDATRAEIRNYSGLLQVRLLCRDHVFGLASAVRDGAKMAQGELLVVMDADLSHPPESIRELLAPLRAGSHDMVIGSRYIPGGGTPEWPFFRKLGSRLATLPARLFTEVHDPLAGFFAVRKEIFLSIDNPVSGFKIGLEILATAGDRLRVTEIPITFVDRKRGSSKMNGKVLIDYLRQLAALGGFPLDVGSKKELALLTGTAVAVDLLLFHFLQIRGYQLAAVHICSFLLACNLGYLLCAATTQTSLSSLRPSALLRYQCVLLLVLFLRGGMMSALSTWFTDTAWPLFLAAAFSSLFASATGFLFVSQKWRGTDRAGNWRLAALLIISYTVLLRILYLGGYELLQEEAYYWNYSQHPAMGYLDHPPMVALLIWLGTHLLGNSEAGVRFGAFFCWFLTAWFSYKLTLSVLGRKAALNALVLTAALPLFFGTALFITPDAPLLACWAGTLFFLHRALVDENPSSWAGVGIFLGLGLVSKYTIVLLGPAIILFMLIDTRSRRWFFKPQPYLAAITALLIFSPVIFWNYQHHWASFLFQSQHRIANAFRFSTPELLAAILLLLTPTGLLAIWNSSRRYGKKETEDNAFVTSRHRRHRLFACCMALLPLSVFVFFSFSREVKLNWAGPLWLAFIPLMATSLPFRYVTGTLRPWPFNQRLWSTTLLTLVLGYGCLLHYFTLGIPGIPFEIHTFLFGGDDLALQVEQTVDTIAKQQGVRPLVVGMDKYRTASGLAFYRKKNSSLAAKGALERPVGETTGRQLFGMNALMFNYWMPSAQTTSTEVLAISKSKENIADRVFAGKATHLGRIHSYTIKKHGKDAGSYCYRLMTLNTPEKIFTPSPPLTVLSSIRGNSSSKKELLMQ